ncbi:glycosyl hydrolase [Ruminococcus sp.]|uniref:glycosyl hydrolase n=1 Tax=Ruminococcus sp. TaxID=41978 RepID=UPI0039949F83
MKIKKKVFAASLAAAMALNAVCVSSFFGGVSAAGETKYEFEDGKITGVSAEVEEVASASGGKVVHMRDAGETIKVTVNVEKAGMYDLNICYATDGGAKTQKLNVNGNAAGDLALSNHTDFSESNVARIKLNAGENELEFVSYWGWTQFDYFTLTEPNYPTLSATSDLADKNATPETQSLMNYLASVYGEHIISGQQEIYNGGPHDFEYEFNYIKDTTGKSPAIRGFDFLNAANPLYGNEDGTTNRMISWAKDNNGIVTASWHITVPKKFSSYNVGDKVDWSNATYKPDETDFDTAKVLEEGSKENEYYKLCLKLLAEQLQKLQDANVPVIFRPLHEAEGGGGEDGSWFWWGKSGSAVYKDLWKLTYKTLTEDYGLHNMIWEWNSYTFETSTNWYPGDEYVDLVAYDKYNCTDWSTGNAVLVHNDSAIGGTFYSLVEQYGGKKMVAMAENDSIPTLENLQMEKAGWLYFCPWYDGGSDSTNFLSNEMFNKKEDLKEIYTSDYCITLDELPENLYSNSGAIITTTSGTGQTTTTTTMTTTTTTMTTTKIENAIMGDIKKDGSTVKVIFDRSMGKEVHLIVDLDDSLGYANGCVGVSVKVDGVDYWVSYKWEASKSDDVTVSLDADNVYNVTFNNGSGTVKDADQIAKIAEAAQKEKEAQFQVWWANDKEGEKDDTTKATLVAAYLPDESGETTETTVTTTDAGTTTTPEETTTEPTESTTTSAEVTTAPNETTTTVTTAATTGSESEALYGDINMDGKVDLTDAVMLNKYQAGLVTLTDVQKVNANCDITDGTENITEEDSFALMRFILMMEGYENLPYNAAK